MRRHRCARRWLAPSGHGVRFAKRAPLLLSSCAPLAYEAFACEAFASRPRASNACFGELGSALALACRARQLRRRRRSCWRRCGGGLRQHDHRSRLARLRRPLRRRRVDQQRVGARDLVLAGQLDGDEDEGLEQRARAVDGQLLHAVGGRVQGDVQLRRRQGAVARLDLHLQAGGVDRAAVVGAQRDAQVQRLAENGLRGGVAEHHRVRQRRHRQQHGGQRQACARPDAGRGSGCRMRHGARRIERRAVHLNRNLSAKIISMSGIERCRVELAQSFAKMLTTIDTRFGPSGPFHHPPQETPP
ncbi:hypothetical protein GALL_304140 [mine drainage metagenome]|uniref:Uncharacterized protein n=1 Tax=mine drainage metagenome TaxID=410659 RepID=A0A1J5RHX4_9ZZZZ